MRQAVKMTAVTIYVLGTAAAGILLGLFVSRCGVVLFPEAMLPIQLWELASEWLAFGSIPMLAASVFFYKAFHLSEGGHRVRNAICAFLPAGVCLCFLAVWIGVWAVGMARLALAS